VDRHNIGVIEAAGRFGLGVESFEVGFAGQVSAENHLHRYCPVETRLAGLIDHAHAPTANFLHEFVVTKLPHFGRGQ
jgi:hypothetical protein